MEQEASQAQQLTDEAAHALANEKQLKLNKWWLAKLTLQQGIPITWQNVAEAIDRLEDKELAVRLHAIPDDLLVAMVEVVNSIPAPDLSELKKAEMESRKEVAKLFFPEAKEGTNYAELGNGWRLKYSHKLDRKVHEELVDATKERLRNEFQINPDPMFKTVHEVAIKEYRSLEKINKEAFQAFEECLVITPGTVQLETVEPKTEE